MEPPPPELPDRLLDGWTPSDRSVETPFDVGFVTVTAHTIVYEDERRRRRVRESTGIDASWRFVFASRIRIRPSSTPSGPLTRLVRSRARDGFEDRLLDRGYDRIKRAGSRTIQTRSGETPVDEYRGRCHVGGTTVPTAAMVAVWPADGEYYVAGGAYPTGPPDGIEDTGGEGLFDPSTDRAELIEFIRETGTPGG